MLSELLANRCFSDLYLQVCMSCYLTNGFVDLLQLHRPRLAVRIPRDPKPTPVRQAGDDSNREPTPVRRRLHRRHMVSPATGHFRDHVRIGGNRVRRHPFEGDTVGYMQIFAYI